jgi:hypothetical protein
MEVKKYLEVIGLEKFISEEFFNYSDELDNATENLINSYLQSKLDLLSKPNDVNNILFELQENILKITSNYLTIRNNQKNKLKNSFNNIEEVIDIKSFKNKKGVTFNKWIKTSGFKKHSKGYFINNNYKIIDAKTMFLMHLNDYDKY